MCVFPVPNRSGIYNIYYECVREWVYPQCPLAIYITPRRWKTPWKIPWKISCINRKIIWVCPESGKITKMLYVFPAFSENATVPDPAGSPWVAAAILPDSQDLPGCCARGTLQRPGMKFYPKTWGVCEILAGDLNIKYQKGDKSRRQGE